MSNVARTQEEFGTVSALGSGQTKYPDTYNPGVLETFENKHPDRDYVVSFDAYELSSLCPRTGQPDFARIYISYIPSKKMVESKSLKLYLFSFRNTGSFHEDIVNIIKEDLVALMEPKYLEVYGDFSSRGGICITPFATYASNKKYEKYAEARQLAMMGHAVNHVPWPR